MRSFDAGTFINEYASAEGQKLWGVLTRRDVVTRMETASDLGHPALLAVEDILLQELGSVILEKRFKQMAGLMTKQILEHHGFKHEISGVRLNSVPFYKASRYRRLDRPRFYLFKSSIDSRDICLCDTRNGSDLPRLTKGRWIFVNIIDSKLKSFIGYGFDLAQAESTIQVKGFFRHRVSRIMRPG